MTRAEMMFLAEVIQRNGQALAEQRGCAPRPVRIVVLVTDAEGAFIGVSSSTPRHDTEACLRAALAGKHVVDGVTIETVGEEVVARSSIPELEP